MYKYLSIFAIIVLLSACTKHSQNPGCSTNKACTALFAYINIKFIDKDGNAAAIKNLTVLNLRTHLNVKATDIANGLNPGVHTVVTDSNKAEFSTDGDDVQISATDSLTNQTKTALLKIAGGCSCHVSKLSGPDQVQFN